MATSTHISTDFLRALMCSAVLQPASAAFDVERLDAVHTLTSADGNCSE